VYQKVIFTGMIAYIPGFVVYSLLRYKYGGMSYDQIKPTGPYKVGLKQMSSVKGNFIAVFYPIEAATGNESGVKQYFPKASPSDNNENYDRLYELQANIAWKSPTAGKAWVSMLRAQMGV